MTARFLWPFRDARLARLVQRSQRGDRDAFRRLYRSLYEPVWQYIRRRVALQADVEDLASQVFFRLLESLPNVDPSRSVLAYTLGVARHHVADHERRRMGQLGEELLASIPDTSHGPLGRLISREEMDAVRVQLAVLPKETRELLMLRFGDELRYSDIAQILDLTEGAVRQRVSRAMRELRATCAERWENRELFDER